MPNTYNAQGTAMPQQVDLRVSGGQQEYSTRDCSDNRDRSQYADHAEGFEGAANEHYHQPQTLVRSLMHAPSIPKRLCQGHNQNGQQVPYQAIEVATGRILDNADHIMTRGRPITAIHQSRYSLSPANDNHIGRGMGQVHRSPVGMREYAFVQDETPKDGGDTLQRPNPGLSFSGRHYDGRRDDQIFQPHIRRESIGSTGHVRQPGELVFESPVRERYSNPRHAYNLQRVVQHNISPGHSIHISENLRDSPVIPGTGNNQSAVSADMRIWQPSTVRQPLRNNDVEKDATATILTSENLAGDRWPGYYRTVICPGGRSYTFSDDELDHLVTTAALDFQNNQEPKTELEGVHDEYLG
jgi:hypothetical protein